MNEQVSISRTRLVKTGRPTHAVAQRRQEELLDRALEMFAHYGFELTTIDAIAGSLNMTKRTIYARYSDKRALFEAAVVRAIDRSFIPMSVLESADEDDIGAALQSLARLQLESSLSVEGIRLQRIANFEAHRFPAVNEKYEARIQGVIGIVMKVLRKRDGAGVPTDELDLAHAAAAFLTLVNTATRSVLLYDRRHKPEEVEAFIDRTVRLFLKGWLPR
jgi:AcrR family transcriptional regulator